jgi:hypothetical protein
MLDLRGVLPFVDRPFLKANPAILWWSSRERAFGAQARG